MIADVRAGQPADPPGALAGITVVDVSRVLAGPYCAQLLGDHGASVVKVEPPAGDPTRGWGPSADDGVSAYYAGLNRNKQHVSIDLAVPAGREILLRLLDDADVLVESFKPGVMERWGLGERALTERFPQLVYCRISAFGRSGGMGGLPGLDAVVQAHAGLMHVNGDAGGPPMRIPLPIADLTTGLLAFSGVLLALVERARSGRGQVVDLNLFDAAVSLLHPAAATYFATGEPPRRMGSAHPSIAPCQVFASPLGDLYVAAGTDHQFRLLCDYLGAPELAEDPRFRANGDRLAHRAELEAVLSELVARLSPTTDVAAEMIAKGIPAALVRPVDTVLADPDLIERGMVGSVGERRTLGIPVHLRRTPGALRTPPREQGADTRDVLAELGYAPSDVEELHTAGVIVSPADHHATFGAQAR